MNTAVRKLPISKKKSDGLLSSFSLINMVVAVICIGGLAGGFLIGKELVELSKIHAQISQLSQFNEAVYSFYNKYEGLPGDLLAAKSESYGLNSGDGKPAHSDGDGKISPCNLGWQAHLGCETALFWEHLSDTALIGTNFSANSRFINERLKEADILITYLPNAAINKDTYITVWNTDASIISPNVKLPYGNYFEISRIRGIEDYSIDDDVRAMTPKQAYAIDQKTDDGDPFHGTVMVNGSVNWPDDSWGSLATPGEKKCVDLNQRYNLIPEDSSNARLCHLAVEIECCNKEKPNTATK